MRVWLQESRIEVRRQGGVHNVVTGAMHPRIASVVPFAILISIICVNSGTTSG